MAGRYHRIIPDQEKILEEFPGLTQQDLDAVDKEHEAFLIYEDSGKGNNWKRTIWTTCCHQERLVTNLERTETQEFRTARWASHNEKVKCPFCGRYMTVKNRRKIRNWGGYERYVPVLFLHVSGDGQTVWAQGYWTTKNLEADPAGTTLYGVTRVYRFRPGEVLAWETSWNDKMCCSNVYWTREPFQKAGMGGNESYMVVGEDRLKKSFLRYTGYDEPMWHEERSLRSCARKRSDLVRYLAIAARYPRQVEMLRKLGIDSAVRDIVRSNRKNAAALNWNEIDPKKAFGLNGQELRAFLQTKKDLYTVELYKKFRKQGQKISMEEAAAYGESLDRRSFRSIQEEATRWQMEPLNLLRYFKKQIEGQAYTVATAWQTWEGYLQAAQGLGYELYKEKVLLPKKLWEAHETATGEHRRFLQEQRDRELREREAKEAAAYELVREKNELRYGVTMGGFIIRAPRGRTEIVNEGLALKHCVGGYADRHIEGKTTILFMRRAEEPDKPFLTIEMQGKRMIQIHGYKNEGLYTAKGRFAPDPREVYRDILDPWLEWINKGSKRDKKGRPMLPKKNRSTKTA